MKFALGIEIGGTKLQAAVGLERDRLMGQARTSVHVEKGAKGILESIPGLIESALKQSNLGWNEIGGIGIGFGGPVDSKRGITLTSHQIQGWDQFPLVQWFRDRFPVPCAIQNDASIAGYAEALLGAGKGFSRVFYITIGSGIGGGWIVDGVIDEGQGLGAAEIGHTWVIDPDIGELEKLELICSGWAIGRRAREAVMEGESSLISHLCGGDIDRITAKTVYAAAERDDPLAKAILDETSLALAVGICNVIALLHPERVVIGGGVSLMGELFWNLLRDKVNQHVFKPFKDQYAIVPAALGEEVVLFGSVLLGRQIGQSCSS